MFQLTSKQKYLIELKNSAVSLVISLLEANYLGHEKVWLERLQLEIECLQKEMVISPT